MNFVKLLSLIEKIAKRNGITLAKFQRDWLFKTFQTDVTISALSIPRGGGKSTLASLILAAALEYPCDPPGFDLFITAGSTKQGGICHAFVCRFLGLPSANFKKDKKWKSCVSHQKTQIDNLETGTTLRVQTSDHATSLGYAPDIHLSDEAGSAWGVRGAETWRAIYTSMIKKDDCKLIAISTQSDSEDHFFSRLLRDKDPGVHSVLYTYDKDDCWESEDKLRAAVIAANPGIEYGFPKIEKVMTLGRMALEDRTQRAAFENYHLNRCGLRDAVNYLLDPQIYRKHESTDTEREGDYVLGIDMGDNVSCSSATAWWLDSGRLENISALPECDGLAKKDKEANTGSRFQDAEAKGELILCGEKTVDAKEFLEELFDRFGGDPVRIVTDTYKHNDVLQALFKMGRQIEVERRSSATDIFEDIRATRKRFTKGDVRPVPNEFLRWSLKQTYTKKTEAGVEKILKHDKYTHRWNDAGNSLMLCCGAGSRLLDYYEMTEKDLGIDEMFAVV